MRVPVSRRLRLFTQALILISSILLKESRSEIRELPEFNLIEGEQRLFYIPGIQKFSLSSAHVQAIRLPQALVDQNSAHLLLKAIKAGHTDLLVWKKDGTTEHRSVHIEKHSSGEKLPPHLRTALSRLQETEIFWKPQGIVLRGKVFTSDEAARIAALHNPFQKEKDSFQIIDETEFSPSLLDQAQADLEKWAKSEPKLDIKIERPTNDTGIWIKGTIQDADLKTQIERKARAVFAGVQLDLMSLPDQAPTIHFRVFLLEVKKTHLGSLGVGWPGLQEQAFQITGQGVRQALKLDLAIQALESEGEAKVLSNPELVVRAPGEAELFAGGELPIKTSTPYNTQVTWRTYGLTLRLKVTHATDRKVRLEVFTEMSHIDSSIAAGSIPGLQSNRMRTEIDATFGQPLFLSGLLQQSLHEEARGLPLLRRIPILGVLFGSDDYLANRSELVVVLLPQKDPPPPPQQQLPSFAPQHTPLPPPDNQPIGNYPWNTSTVK